MIDVHYLTLLAKEFPDTKKASTEIINLMAILSLPKGTEYFFSDLHGEHESFIHMMKSASGVVRSKIDDIFGKSLSMEDRDRLASLIYDPEAEINRRKNERTDIEDWYRVSIFRLIETCKAVSTKYTRSKVRKRLPKGYDVIIDELLHADDESNREHYYREIINSIVECQIAEGFITQLSYTISRLAVDRLHIIGDVYDRGPHPDYIMDYLLEFHDVDFQWGNHDIVWMGAATGNWACISNVIRINVSYNNFDMLEIGYGINLRPLASFALSTYGDDQCEFFYPHILDKNIFDPVDEGIAAKMHKAMTVIQFKVEGQRIKAHPEFRMEDRLLLDKVDYENGTIVINGKEYALRDKNFPTVDPNDPYKLTDDEELLMSTLEASFLESSKLQKHIRFLYSHGAMYSRVNGNLLYHGCIPMTDEGEFEECAVNNVKYKGKALLDYLDTEVRRAYFDPGDSEETGLSGDIMWYLWLGSKSPLFGKDRMTTFERCFIADKATHKEKTAPYYKLIEKKEICEKILEEFGLSSDSSHIVNGHVPVKLKDGESPSKGGGRLFIIDGGMSKAYQKTTGIAGYTFIFNSRSLALAEHKPYSRMQKDGTQKFHSPEIKIVETLRERMTVADTDMGDELKRQVKELKMLVSAYKKGVIKEKG
ncbi:MAG: fructose-1,6-bisphosphatase [Clostridiales bacterium]|nr:fructose-1,6-bisphosphatase [Clostridiales bacterium]